MSLVMEIMDKLHSLAKKIARKSIKLGDNECDEIKYIIGDDNSLDLIETTDDRLVKAILIDYSIRHKCTNYDKLWKYCADAIWLPTDMRNKWKVRPDNKWDVQNDENAYILSVIDELSINNIPEPGKIRTQILDKLSAYYCAGCPWTSTRSTKLCQNIIDKMHITEGDMKEIIYTYEEPVNEFSAKNFNDKLTAEGRKRFWKNNLTDIVSSPLVGNTYTDDLETHKKFVDDNIYRINGLKFVVDNISAHMIEEYWGIIFTLTNCFLDDTDTLIKIEACKVIQRICRKLAKGSNVIVRGQVEPIIFDGVVPVILSLPSMTPPDISKYAIQEGYKTIFSLWDVSLKDKKELNLKLSMLLNDFICPSLIKVSDTPGLVSILTNVINEQLLPLAGSYRLVLRKQLLYTILDALSNPALKNSDDDLRGCLEVIRCLDPRKLKKFRFDILACLLRLQKMRKLPISSQRGQKSDINDKIELLCLELGFKLKGELSVQDMTVTDT